MPAPPHSALLSTLKLRFTEHMARHPGIAWSDVLARLQANSKKLKSLEAMERTGGEPDVIRRDLTTGEVLFCDCSSQSPKGRVNTCYDSAALASRKTHKPSHSALGMAEEMGVDILTESDYHQLQTLGEFDTKTSSWIATPADIRKLGGALFCDRRFGHIFTYHNGAESYYSSRGFRTKLTV